MQEFAIIDNDGKLFGLPAKTFTSRTAAHEAMHYLMQRRKEMKDEAKTAAELLASREFLLREDVAKTRQEFEDTIRRWELEEPRRYSIYSREVSPWVPQK